MRYLRNINESKHEGISKDNVKGAIEWYMNQIANQDIEEKLLPKLIDKVGTDNIVDMIIDIEDLFFSFIMYLYEKTNDFNKIKKYLSLPQAKQIIPSLADTFVGDDELEIVKFLFSKGAKPDDILYDDQNYLFYAYSKEMIEYLISVGCDVNHKNKYGYTPLTKIAYYTSHGNENDTERMVSLLNNGADPKIKTKRQDFIDMCFSAYANGDKHIKINDDVIVALLENNPNIYNDKDYIVPVKDFLTYDSIKKRISDIIDSDEIGLL